MAIVQPDPYEIAIDEFVSLLRAGKKPCIDAFASQYSDLEYDIRLDLEGLMLTEHLRPPGMPPTKGSVQSDELSLPGEISGYTLNRKIAAGGMGTVYEATQQSLQRKVVLKVLSKERAASSQFFERFEREAISASRLHHPNIVSVFDYGVDNGQAWLAMPFIDGNSLDSVVGSLSLSSETHEPVRAVECSGASLTRNVDAHLPQTWKDIALLGSQVARALEDVHESGTLHRDIKPANLILDRDGKVWVTDFGLAKLRDDNRNLSRTGDMIGTPHYMSPEQVRGIADARSDVYGLGITLWELCSGKRAWESIQGSRVDLERKYGVELKEVSEANPEIPQDLANIIMKACAYHPQDRYQSAEELEHVLNRFAQGEKIGDRRNGPRDVVSRPYLRRPFLAMALITSGIMGFIAASAANDAFTNYALTKYATVKKPPASVVETLIGETSDPGEIDRAVASHLPKHVTELNLNLNSAKSGEGIFQSTLNNGFGSPFEILQQDQDVLYVDQLHGVLRIRKDAVLSPGENYHALVSLVTRHPLSGLAFGGEDGEKVLWRLEGSEGTKYDALWGDDAPAILRDSTRLLGLCSNDGRIVYHAHLDGERTQLWLSEVVSESPFIVSPRCIQRDCGLPAGVKDFATFDGNKFYALTRGVDGEQQLHTLQLMLDGTFSAADDPMTLPIEAPVVLMTMNSPDSLVLFVKATGISESWNVELSPNGDHACVMTGEFDCMLDVGSFWRVANRAASNKQLRLRITADPVEDTPVSVKSTSSMMAVFVNDTNEEVLLVWVNGSGVRVPYRPIAPRAAINQQTFAGHVWEAYGPDGDRWLLTTADRDAATVSITRPK